MTNSRWRALGRARRQQIAQRIVDVAPGIMEGLYLNMLEHPPARIESIHAYRSAVLSELRAGDEEFPPFFFGFDLEAMLRGWPREGGRFDMPLYEHDCDKCQYLGQIADSVTRDLDTDTAVDAYICTGAGYASIALRRSDDPEDYTSMPYSWALKGPALAAFRIAIERLHFIGAPGVQ
jgi:hypothetical protein